MEGLELRKISVVLTGRKVALGKVNGLQLYVRTASVVDEWGEEVAMLTLA